MTGRGFRRSRRRGCSSPFPAGRPATCATLQRTGAGEVNVGLAISYRLCRMMGGDLAVQSAPGAGTTFIARMPIEPL